MLEGSDYGIEIWGVRMVFKVLKLEEMTKHMSVYRNERKPKHGVLRSPIFRYWEEEAEEESSQVQLVNKEERWERMEPLTMSKKEFQKARRAGYQPLGLPR